MEKRKEEVFLVKRARTERLRKSAPVNMQKSLNKDLSEKRDSLKKIIVKLLGLTIYNIKITITLTLT